MVCGPIDVAVVGSLAVDGDVEDRPETYLDRYRCLACRRRVDAHAGAGCDDWAGVTPRFAWALHGALLRLGDWWVDDPQALDLPRIAERMLGDERFLTGMQASAHRVADEIAAGRSSELLCRSTADEVNLAMALDDALAQLTDSREQLPPTLDHPRTVDPIEDYYDAGQILRADTDVEMLFNPALDGIESDEQTLRRLGVGAGDLRPEHWLEPFRPTN